MAGLASGVKRGRSWVHAQPWGPAAARRAKRLLTTGRDLHRRALAELDGRGGVPPVEWTSARDLPPVVPEVPVDLTALRHYRAEAFPRSGPALWLDRKGARRAVARAARRGEVTPYEAHLCRAWARDGFAVIDGLFTPERLDYVWDAYESAIGTGAVRPPMDAGEPLPGRALNPHFDVPEIAELGSDPALRGAIELLLGASAIHFQSISGHRASQQPAHSDSIHMTTYPEHHLAAAWIAFEDIQEGSGPLVYYPGSHTLPTLYSEQVGIDPDAVSRAGYAAYHAQYEPAIGRVVEERGLRPELFHAKKGDVLLWHANLLHGGAPRADASLSRRALVFHYFAEGCVCYHDLSGLPSPEDQLARGRRVATATGIS